MEAWKVVRVSLGVPLHALRQSSITPQLAMPLLSYATPRWTGESSSGSDGDGPTKYRDASRQTGGRLSCEVGVIKDSSGSAFLSLGGASVVCSVHGPRALQQRGVMEGGYGSVECDLRYAPFSIKPTAGGLPENSGGAGSGSSASMTNKEKYLSQVLKEALVQSIRLDLYPKMSISVSVLILQSSGNTGTDLAAAITSASLSVVDAMIEILDFVVATAVGLSMPPSTCHAAASAQAIAAHMLDPSATQQGEATLMIATMPSSAEITQVFYEGKIDADAIPSLISIARHAAESLRGGLSACIKNRKQLQ